ncbi:MAG: hypothetical protein AMXMBFR33_70600 [Candidatus Xenobia bacterium]
MPPGSIVLLFGPPAAGKSSLARELVARYRALGGTPPLIYLGTDPLREMIAGRSFVASIRPSVYEGMRVMAERAARDGHHVVLDGNYLEPGRIRPIATLARRLGARLLKVLVTCSLELGLRRNAGRLGTERVPEDYLRQVYARVRAARRQADMVIDQDPGGPSTILSWLLGTPVQPDAPACEALLEEWRREGHAHGLAQGQLLWSAGSPAGEVVLVQEGRLEVLGEQEVVLRELGPGDLAGELSSFDQVPHSATVRARTACRVVALESGQFRSLLRHYPQLLEQVLASLAGRIRSLSTTAGSASVDLLTGLGNRRLLEERFPTLCREAVKQKSSLSLALFDIDRFKGINDTYGHQAGDVVLRDLGALMRACLPPPAVCLRYGGDEFVVLMPGLNGEAARLLLTDFARRVRETSFVVDQGVWLRATVSVGIASYPEATKGPEELHRLADEAAYTSKREGRDRVTVYAP